METRDGDERAIATVKDRTETRVGHSKSNESKEQTLTRWGPRCKAKMVCASPRHYGKCLHVAKAHGAAPTTVCPVPTRNFRTNAGTAYHETFGCVLGRLAAIAITKLRPSAALICRYTRRKSLASRREIMEAGISRLFLSLSTRVAWCFHPAHDVGHHQAYE